MKQFTRCFLFAGVIAGAHACNESDVIEKTKIHFHLSLQSETPNSSVAHFSGSSVIIHLTKSDGEEIEKEISDGFNMTAGDNHPISLSLSPGNYFIDDIMVVDENDRIVYASPKSNSFMADVLNNPYNFSVVNGSDIAFPLTLLETRKYTAESFGYKSFERPQSINVAATIKGSAKPVTGTALILKGETIVGEYQLAAKTNQLRFNGDNASIYTLIVTKSGYTTYQQSFTTRQPKKPVKATLEPAFTILARTDNVEGDFMTFQLEIGGESGTVFVGSQPFDLTIDPPAYIELGWPTPGTHLVTITGELDQITYLKSFYGYGMMDDIDLRHLTNLKEFRFGLSRSPTVLDFSHNLNLQQLYLPALTLERIILPENHMIRSIDLDGNIFTSNAFDDLISNLYENAMRNNYAGGLSFAASWYQEPEDESTIAPVSQSSLEKMAVMKTYGWSFYPDILD
jgi:hypothetical protein